MTSPTTDRIAEATLLRGLVAGLALMLILLGVAGVVAVRGTRAIEADTARVVREQLVMARLLNDAQAGQNLLAAVLHQVARTPLPAEEARLLKDLESADRGLDRLARSAAATPERERWTALHRATRQFSQGVRQAIRLEGTAPGDMIRELFAQHDRVVRLEQELLTASEDRVAATESKIEAESRLLGQRSLWLLGACLALSILCAVLMVLFARNTIRKIQWQTDELGRVSWHMLRGQEDTARRFSHELHDELGQALAAVRANLAAGSGADWAARREDCVELVDGAIANVRELSQLLRPVVLDDFGLDAGLRWLSERFAGRTGIRVDYQSKFAGRLRDESETHLFRIAQEAFTNIARHSGATEVRVALAAQGDTVRLTIADNGRGLRNQDDRYTPSLGMTGMRARARQAGGELRLGKPSGGGLRIDVEIPRMVEEDAHVGS